MVDMNGDGMKDIVGFGQSGIFVSLNEGENFARAERWSSAFSKDSGWTSSRHIRQIVDLNNDNLPDIIGFGDDGIFVSLNDDGKLLAMNKWSSNFGFNKGWTFKSVRLLEDMNNDGFIDIVGIRDKKMMVYFNNQSSFENGSLRETILSPRICTGNLFTANCPTVGSEFNWSPVFYRLIDTFSRGQKSFFFIPGINITSIWNNETENLVSFGTASFSEKTGWKLDLFYRNFIDLNNDQIPDLVGIDNIDRIHAGIASPSSSPNWQQKYFLTSVLSLGEMNAKKSKTPIENVFNADLNGDGLPDFIFFQCDGIFVTLNKGVNFTSEVLWENIADFCNSGFKPHNPVDVNGDSLADLVLFSKNSAKIYLNQNRKPILVGIKDSLGNEKKILYQSIANRTIYSESEFDFNSSYSSKGFALNVVSKFSSSNGIGGMSSIEYKYGGYVCSKIQGRSCSFGWIKSKNQASKIFSIEEFYHQYPLTGIIRSKSTYYRENLLTKQKFKYKIKETKLIDKKSAWNILVEKKNSQFYDINGLLLKNESDLFEYDEFGNVVKTISSMFDQNSNYTVVVINEISNDLNKWYLGKLDSKKVYYIWQNGLNKDIKMKQENYSYDEISRKIIKKITNKNLHFSLEEMYQYDKMGNLIKVTKNGRKSQNVFEERIFKFFYDNLGINKIKETNALGHNNYYFYDENDNLIKFIDENNVTKMYAYNDMGQKIFESIQGKSNSTSEYFEHNGIMNSVYCISNKILGGKKTTNCFDSLNRVIRKITNGFNEELIYEDTVYNENGLVEKQSVSYKAFEEEPRYTTFEYDDLLREVARYEPYFDKKLEEKIETIYRGNHVITSDSTGFLKIETKNILGKISRVEDGEKSVSFYEYDAFQNLVDIIDPQGISTNSTFDNNGNKIKNFDPYMGYTEHEYNSFGELVATVNHDGTETKTERDLIGRVVKLIEPDGTTFKTYDSGLYSYGKLSKLKMSSGYQLETKFDKYSRQIWKKYLFNSSYQFFEEFEYDQFGRILSTQAYKLGGKKFKIFYCYKNGYLAALSVDDKDCIKFAWKAIDYGSNGKIKEEEYGNGIKNKYSYDETDMATEILSSKNIQLINKLKYDYDIRRNLVKSEEFNPLLSTKFVKKFSYDSLDRIISESNFEQVDQLFSLKSVLSWSYDNIGNILNHDNFGRQNIYNYDPIRPQLATLIGDEQLVYDNFGRIIKTNSYSVDWYSFSKPRKITKQNSTVEYLYGLNKELVMKKTIADKTSMVVRYIGDNYENWEIGEKTIEKYHVKVFGRAVTLFIDNIESNSSLYLHSDGFNSINLITNSQGETLIRYNYTPFGYRQTSFINTTNDLNNLLNRGFSGKEVTDDDRLIFFGGRIFDCVLLRFLSPDLFIQEPFNIQNLNRYSYGLNNPYKYNDPSGFLFKKLGKIFKNPKVLLAVAVGVATSFILAPVAAGLAAAAVSATKATGIAASAIYGATAGAVTGAGSGLASSLVMTDGNLKQSLKGAYKGALSGSLSGLLGSAFNNQYAKFSAETVAKGVDNRLNGEKFFSDFDLNLFSFASTVFYEKIVGYELDASPGGEAANKGLKGRPVKGANNIGCQTGTCGNFNEGGTYSVWINRIPGVNAIAGLHDIFQISLPENYYVRDILNVPGMPVAALYTYASIYHQVECPFCEK